MKNSAFRHLGIFHPNKLLDGIRLLSIGAGPEKISEAYYYSLPTFFLIWRKVVTFAALYFTRFFFPQNLQILNLAEFLLRVMLLQNNYLLVSFLYSKQRKDNLTIAYAKMKDFINPVNMVYSYEVAQTPQNKRLKGLLMDVRLHLRATVNALRRMVRMRKKYFY